MAGNVMMKLNQNINVLTILTFIIVNNKNKEKNNLEDPVLFCDGCFALASELHKDLSSTAGAGLKLRERVEASLAAVCSTDRLRSSG